MSFKCQFFSKRMTFNGVCMKSSCDVRIIIFLGVLNAILLPIIKCAKLENPQIRLLINDDDLLQEKSNLHEAAAAAAAAAAVVGTPDSSSSSHSGEHFNLYRSELKRLSYETIHRILRDENEPSYRREETELRYYQKRSPSYEESHQLIKRSALQQQQQQEEQETVIKLQHRNLTEFPTSSFVLKQLKYVSVLDLSDNLLSHLNVSCLNNSLFLKTLNLKNNSFNYIPLSQDTRLRTLNLNYNLIKTSTLSANIYLRNLFLSANHIEQLSSIDFSLLRNLESLDISHNLLSNTGTSFFTQRMHNLKHLNLAFNHLGSIYRETFYNLLSLNTLLLSHNNITDIDYETFLALPNLQYLDLSFNALRGKSIRALQGITGLVALNIAFNPDIGPYMQEFVASWSLKELDASGTGLCQIPAALAQSVRSLKLTHNWLKIINCGDLDSYPLLQYLDLSFSHIEQIEDDALGRLEILEILMLDHNKLRKIPVSLPVSLEHVFLQNNDIMEITQQAFQGLTNLKTLDLSHNKLLYLPDIFLPKLQTLNLQSSQIKGISQGIIHSLPRLNDLMLEDNPIKCTDLLGIAEWASTCRLRGEKDDEEEMKMEQDNFVLKGQILKTKFEHMHNFYEQFDFNATYSVAVENLQPPKCAQENLKNETNSLKKEKQKEKLFEYTKTTAPTVPVKSLEVEATQNNSMKTFPNMTEVVVESVAKRSKEMEQLANVQQQKSTMKTFQTTTTKIKKWIKEETKTISQAKRPENKTKDLIATATTFANSTQATATFNTSSTIAEAAAATSDISSPTTITEKTKESSNSTHPKGMERRVAVAEDEKTGKLLEINLGIEKQQRQQQDQQEIKTKIATSKEIKSSATALNPKNMQTKQTNKLTIKQNYKPAELTGNLEIDQLLEAETTRTTITQNTFKQEKGKDFTTISPTITKFFNKTHKIRETPKTLVTAAAAAASMATEQENLDDLNMMSLKDLQSDYNENENNRQIEVKTLNKSKIVAATATTKIGDNFANTTATTITLTNNHSLNNENHKKPEIFDNVSTAAITIQSATPTTIFTETKETILNAKADNQEQKLSLKAPENVVHIKCMRQSNNNGNECNNPQQQLQEDKPGRMPKIESTLEQTTAITTSTQIPTIANTAALKSTTTARATATTTALSSTPVALIHKHEPLQLLVKDRHLIGTPLLMHKGDNLLVTADELIHTTNNISSGNNKQSIHNGLQDVDDNRQHNLEEEIQTTMVTDKNYLVNSQTTKTFPFTTTTLETPLTTAANLKKQEQNYKQPADPVDLKEFGKWQKSSHELKTKKPSLIMKKMTIITKQHEQQQFNTEHVPQMAVVQSLENEVHSKQIDNSHYQELKPLVHSTTKHSTVNTVVNSHDSSNSKRQAANLLKEPPTFQHEHELLIQQILQDQQAETHEKLTKTEQWSDLRKAKNKENHPGLILLVSSGLFLVLLLGLMHVYRCDMPWRRHSPSHHLRPHQRQNHSFEDDSHSFLSYSEGMQKWHHSTRLEAPYNSPLHNLHVRELQKTSACERPATVKLSATSFKPQLSRAIMLNNSRSLSQSSTTSTSTASPSSSAILDDESFYIEMTPDSGHMAQALQSELLPMELLNMKQLPSIDYHEAAMADSHTSLDEDSVVHFDQQQQQQQRQHAHATQMSSHSTSANTGNTASSATTCSTTSVCVKPQSQTRKFGLW